ncbi:class I SAM-dependent methyltransferase [Roseovarius sp.]|uniref:class I SAM-dependent methyltransferase n=1 Tax=Roseovarius sp. TaxID=1486281 RepID=UPI003515966D
MTGLRLSLALDEFGLPQPEAGAIVIRNPVQGADLSALPRDRSVVVTGFQPDFTHFEQQGFRCVTEWDEPAALTLVCLSRAKDKTRAAIARASAQSGVVVVDGVKTDGVDAVLRDCRKRVDLSGPVNKAHGKLFWFAGDTTAFDDWAAQGPREVAPGLTTLPGVFSADGIDPASEALAKALPAKLGRDVADLGAGWGYLSSRILQIEGIETVHLVEAEHDALACARRNLDDARAQFHWQDARIWTPEGRLDAVVMNPPFHTGRTAEPELGRDFIRAAARLLKPSGQLWMVANRHLPYETTLGSCFGDVTLVTGDNRFKIFHARRPSRQAG